MPSYFSLPALRSFIEVGRNGSIKGAAGELGVTPGAVSQQIKTLERQLGVCLFERGNREIKLTREGVRLFASLSAGFQQIDDAMARFTERRTGPDTLVVSTTPSFAACWLTARIGRFAAENPKIEVRVETTEQVLDFKAAGIDVAIRHGTGHWPDLDTTPLLSTRLVMIASPELIDGHLTSPEECFRYPLLHDRHRSDWITWLKAVGVKLPQGALKGLSYADDTLLVKAASAGQGLALVRDISVIDDLASGRVVLASDISVPLPETYHVVVRHERVRIPKIERFRKWLMKEAEQTISSK